MWGHACTMMPQLHPCEAQSQTYCMPLQDLKYLLAHFTAGPQHRAV